MTQFLTQERSKDISNFENSGKSLSILLYFQIHAFDFQF